MHNYSAVKISFAIALLLAISSLVSVTAQSPVEAGAAPCEVTDVSSYAAKAKNFPCGSVEPAPDLYPVETRLGETSSILNGEIAGVADFTYLVFSRISNGNYEIYGSAAPWDSDGIINPTRMTTEPADDTRPRLRPGSTQIVFSSNRTGNYELFLMDWGGGNLRQLTNRPGDDLQPAWSPDGSKIAYSSIMGGNKEIAVMQADGTGVVQLTFRDSDDVFPAWSPDGTRLVWIRLLGDYGEVYTMNADGSNQQQITQSLLFAENPHWSKDGSLITFDCDLNQDGWNDLVKVNPDGSGLGTIINGSSAGDYLAGPWSGVLDRELLFTKYSYGDVYLSTCVGAVDISTNIATCLPNSYLDFYPDAALVDMIAPQTTVLPLPEYARAGNVGVTVAGSDVGLAGVYALYLQYRVGLDGVWQDWGVSYYANSHTFIYTGQPGSTVYFRSSGLDGAGNREPYPEGNGDAQTKVYAWQLFGSVTDPRGQGLGEAQVVTDPVFSDQANADLAGQFHRYVPSTEVSVEVGQEGYGVLPGTTLSSLADLDYHWALPPQDDLVVNGNFESGLEGWSAAGEYTTTVDADNYHTGTASVALGSSLSQAVSLSPTLNQPTLSFFTYAEQEGEGGTFEVKVNETLIYTATELQPAWEHTWLDLSAWVSQTVTVTFAVSSDPELGLLRVNLDDVSLGSWLTPVVAAVDPVTLEAWEAVTITITGENFIATPAVKIGETLFTDVDYVDEHTLLLTIPGGLAPGLYRVEVINPAGQAGMWQSLIKVGEVLFLPFVHK